MPFLRLCNAGLRRNYRASLWSRKDLDGSHSRLYDQEELSRVVHQRRERAAMEVSIPGAVAENNNYLESVVTFLFLVLQIYVFLHHFETYLHHFEPINVKQTSCR